MRSSVASAASGRRAGCDRLRWGVPGLRRTGGDGLPSARGGKQVAAACSAESGGGGGTAAARDLRGAGGEGLATVRDGIGGGTGIYCP